MARSAANRQQSQYGPQSTQTYLRGIQTTNSNGEVTFTTIYPGLVSRLGDALSRRGDEAHSAELQLRVERTVRSAEL